MIDESKIIFFTGAPGSKWSAVSNALSLTPKIKVNTTDRTDNRVYTHPTKFNSQQHLGTYFGPGMELGHNWHQLHKLTREEILSEINGAWTEERPDEYRIVKSHVISNNLDWIAENFPKSKIMIVFRPVESCYKGWFGAGGFNITYPTYADHYIDEPTMRGKIEDEIKDARSWIYKKQLNIHVLTQRHWAEYWDIDPLIPDTKEFKNVRSIEGYMTNKKRPERDMTYDTNVAYYNFQDIDRKFL